MKREKEKRFILHTFMSNIEYEERTVTKDRMFLKLKGKVPNHFSTKATPLEQSCPVEELRPAMI